MRRTISMLVLASSLGCNSPPQKPSSAPTAEELPPPAPSIASTDAAGPAESDFTINVRRILRESQHPAAAVVLTADARVLVLADHDGADPVRLALRPGSTLKPLLTMTALKAGVLPAPRYACTGSFALVEGLRCFGAHGELDLVHAIQSSCNGYFYDVALRLGLRGVQDGFRAYGFGRETGLVSGESKGDMPDVALLRSRQPNPNDPELWPGFAPVIGTGHGPIQVTLLQLTRAYTALAQELTRPEPMPGVDESGRAQILQGLRQAVQNESGTGRLANVAGFDIVGKTGSAEPGRFDDEASSQGDDNGWFVGFAPAAEPRFVVGVLTLGGAPGGGSAAPLAGAIFETIATR